MSTIHNVGIFTFESAVARSWINQGPGPMLVAGVCQDPKLECVSMGYCKGASGIRLLLGLVTFILCWDKQRHEDKRRDVVMRPGILIHRATEQSHEERLAFRDCRKEISAYNSLSIVDFNCVLLFGQISRTHVFPASYSLLNAISKHPGSRAGMKMRPPRDNRIKDACLSFRFHSPRREEASAALYYHPSTFH